MSTRFARDVKTGKAYEVPDDMTYAEWKKTQDEAAEISEKPLKNNGESGIINKKTTLTKINSKNEVVNPMNEQRYTKMKTNLEKKGCNVISAKGDDKRFLLAFQAEAISDEFGIMHLGKTPSASAFFEEIIHFTQIQRYGAVGESDFVERAAREVAANRKLLRFGKLYGFTKEDFSDISHNLNFWEKDFLERTGMSYDENNIRREI